MYLSDIATYAQSRGSGPEPAVSSAHAPDSHSTTDHGKSTDHTTHAKDTKAAHYNTDWVNDLNPNLKDRLTQLIPTGTTKLVNGVSQPMTLADVAAGFKNKGQCIAFLHAAKNLNLSTTDWISLRTKMTGADPEPLGKALHEVKPNLSETQVKAETEKAEQEAKADQKIKTKQAT